MMSMMMDWSKRTYTGRLDSMNTEVAQVEFVDVRPITRSLSGVTESADDEDHFLASL